MLPASQLGGTYDVPPRIIHATIAHLRQYPRVEAVCYWLGSRDRGRGNVNDVWVPDFTSTAVSYDVKPVEMLRLKAHLDNSGLCLLAQVHSHPGAAFHSQRDDLNAVSPWPGFISIVVPSHGHIRGGFWESVEIYELLGGAEWKHLAQEEKALRFIELES